MALGNFLVVFIIGLLIGAIGIYFAGRLITGEGDYLYAVGTAFIGALVWSIVNFFVGGIPGLGPILALIAWIWVINSRYPGGWINASLIGLISWITVILVLALLASFGVGNFGAIGVPV